MRDEARIGGRDGGEVVVRYPNEDGLINLSCTPNVALSVRDAEHLAAVLKNAVRATQRLLAEKVPARVDIRGFEYRWEAMGNSRFGGWTVEQEHIIAESWGVLPPYEIGHLVTEQRKKEATARGGQSFAVLGERGVMIRAAAMGIITGAEGVRFAGVESNTNWPKYRSPEAP